MFIIHGHSGTPPHISYQQRVKEANIKRIFDLIRSGRCNYRSELGQLLNLSATSVSVLVEDLTARDLLCESGPHQTFSPGRRPISLRINGGCRQMAVFTLSDRGVRFDLIDLDSQLLESLFVERDSRSMGGEEAGDAYAELFTDILTRRSKKLEPEKLVMVGVVFSGVYLENTHLFSMRLSMGVTLSEDSMRRFQAKVQVPVCVSNDAMCTAYYEKKRLDAQSPGKSDVQDMLLVKVGEIISGALLVNGELYTGPVSPASKVGHVCIDYQGLPCMCGSRGCLNRYVSLDIILEKLQRVCAEKGRPVPGSLEGLSEDFLREEAVSAVLDDIAEKLAAGLYSCISLYGVRKLVLGGGIEALGAPFLEKLYRRLSSRSQIWGRLELSYISSGPLDDTLGIVNYFLDKVFTITC